MARKILNEIKSKIKFCFGIFDFYDKDITKKITPRKRFHWVLKLFGTYVVDHTKYLITYT